MKKSVVEAANTFCGAGANIMVHSIVSNEGKTSDGIVRGGQRVFEEVTDVVKREVSARRGFAVRGGRITMSMIGNSLGGLYARYASTLLYENFSDRDGNMFLSEPVSGRLCELSFNVFCTTSSPHLGVSKHTYVPVPRFAELLIGNAMGQTGRDLFRINDLVESMCTSARFLVPLASFRKRVAYANTFRTGNVA